MSKGIKKIASFALPIVGNLIAPGIGGIIGGAAGGALSGGGLKGALLGGATSFAGNAIGGALSPSIASAGLKGTVGSVVGKTAANTLGSAISNTALSGIAGNAVGNYIADSAADSFMGDEEQDKPKVTGPAPFEAKRQAQLQTPSSLVGQDEAQQSSNLATQGVYGGGLGGEEQSYFQNLINRRLVDDAGNVDTDLSEVSPIEQSYLAQLGLGGYSNSKSLLEAMSKWKAT